MNIRKSFAIIQVIETEKESGKTEKMIRAAEACLHLLERHGIESVTFARVARSAKVSRPWLYKYVGQTKKSLIEFALDHYGEILAELSHRPDPHTAKEWVRVTLEGTDRLLTDALKYPWVIQIYFRFRGTTNLVGQRISQIEGLYVRKFSNEIQKSLGVEPKAAIFLAQTLTALRMGIAHQWITSRTHEEWERVSLLRLTQSVLKKMTSSLSN